MEMQYRGNELKKLSDLVTDGEVFFRIHDNVASLETVVQLSWSIFAGVSLPLSEYFFDDESTKDCADESGFRKWHRLGGHSLSPHELMSISVLMCRASDVFCRCHVLYVELRICLCVEYLNYVVCDVITWPS
jgi:hypothetical protein